LFETQQWRQCVLQQFTSQHGHRYANKCI
jgi:hypothetical protein